MNIKKRAEKIKDKIMQLHFSLANLQNECTHDNVEREYRGSTGNYDRSQDGHWIQFTCPDCGKRWTEDQ